MTSKNTPLFFSGFSLAKEAEIFKHLLDHQTPFCIAGFSYGAIKAFEYALNSGKRVDKLQLFSPAFFQDKDEKYRRLQLMFYKKDAATYTKNFLANCAYPSRTDLIRYLEQGSAETLQDLLEYQWDEQRLQTLQKNGTRLEIHLGKADKIINAEAAREFFSPYATIYFYQHGGHILKGDA